MAKVAENRAVCIAVLPFENFSGHRDDDYFSRGFVEDLIADLARFPNLQVISSYTSRKVGVETRRVVDVARDLSIDYLLQGNLRRKLDQLRISTQLLDTADDRIVWAEHYDVPMEAIFEIQDEIVARVVGAISTQIDKVLLAAARKKPLTSLAAYDCWLRGMDLMRSGTSEADLEARRIFKQALQIDPDYGRAYSGLSLSWFNDLSCQVWENWEKTAQQAFKYALQASRLDETDHVVQMILGRILLFRRRFDQAEAHLDNSLALNANDADCLVHIAYSKAYLGKATEGEQLYLKARRLNPYRKVWYYPYGAFTLVAQRKYEAFIETALKGPLTGVWIDIPAYMAVAHANLGRPREAAEYLDIFLDTFATRICEGRTPRSDEVFDWLGNANPFKFEEDARHLFQGLMAAGLNRPPDADRPAGDVAAGPGPATPNRFIKEEGLWQMTFDGQTVRMAEVKGLIDIARLLAVPEREIHCMELMGSPAHPGEPEPVLDDKARRAYEARLRELREEIRDAEAMNDLGRMENLSAEFDQLTDHLSRSLGLGKRARNLDPAADRARAAVTLRIRSAIRKIHSVHPSLAEHFNQAIHTGLFCSYLPGNTPPWEL